ncbi:MAG: DUF502 domain-containing protein [Desulfobacterales bacterium]|nr:DUF502 domain-containing protein [Desulfobacterales bacterium]
MDRLKNFIKTAIIGGIGIILPVALTLFIFKWIYNLIRGIVRPLTRMVMERSQIQEFMAIVLVILIILFICFVIGVIVKTKMGRFFHESLEDSILKIAPGYTLIKETVMQFLGKKKMPFSSVALVRVFENDTLMTAFVTDTHDDGSYTVFVPTGPNPTSGVIYHLKNENVHPVSISIEETMRSIISCGAGSSSLINAYASTKKET